MSQAGPIVRFHCKMKRQNRELLTELRQEYGVRSAAKALNRLLDEIRAQRQLKKCGTTLRFSVDLNPLLPRK